MDCKNVSQHTTKVRLINRNHAFPSFFPVTHTQTHQTWSGFGYQRKLALALVVTSPPSWPKSSSSIRLKAANTLPHLGPPLTYTSARLAVEEKRKRCRIISAIRDQTFFTTKVDQASQISCCQRFFCFLCSSFFLMSSPTFSSPLCLFRPPIFTFLCF